MGEVREYLVELEAEALLDASWSRVSEIVDEIRREQPGQRPMPEEFLTLFQQADRWVG
jgi:hypothetical protein